MNAIADALGVDVTELDDVNLDEAMDVIQHDLTDPGAAYAAMLDADAPTKWRAREAAFREAKGITGKRKSVPPSRTPEARRKRHLQGLVDAGKYPDLATAERSVARKHKHTANCPVGCGGYQVPAPGAVP